MLAMPAALFAGIYDASEEVTYKEYWVPHEQWPSYDLLDNTCTPLYRGWFLESTRNCSVEITFDLPDDVADALKAEIYLDLWRAYDEQESDFRLNGSELYHSAVGSDWSRTPWVGRINLSDLRQGANVFTYPTTRPHHVQDIAIRVYHDPLNPIVPGTGSDVSAPTGQLLTVQGDGAAVDADSRGTLMIDGNQVTLTAQVDGDAAFVEFHGYYFGYDEDNDGNWLDWHNRGRNNCHPGGARDPNFSRPTSYRCPHGNPDDGDHGTIDHIGTAKTNGAGQYSVTWDATAVPDQENVRFKIRIVDSQGNVRDAAGGVSSEFRLQRSNPVVALFKPNFEDTGLSIAPRTHISQEMRIISLPPGISDFNNAKIVQSFWRRPQLQINGHGPFSPNFANGDSEQLSTISVNSNWLNSGYNNFLYISQFYAFVEKPGPMILLQHKGTAGADTDPPEAFNFAPAINGTDVPANTKIGFQLFDSGLGVDESTIELRVDGAIVAHELVGSKYNYFVDYQSPSAFVAGQVVEIGIDACDLGGNCVTDLNYEFTVYAPPLPSDIVSDDFNSCSLNEPLWQWIDPLGDSEYLMDGEAIQIHVPTGLSHDLWKNDRSAPRLIQSVSDADFNVEAKFETTPDPMLRNQIQGIIVQKDDDTFLRFGVYGNGTDVKVSARYVDGSNAVVLEEQEISPQAEMFYLRLARSDDSWTASYSADGESWIGFADVHQPMAVTGIGFYAGNSGDDPGHTVAVDYFFERSAPITIEDEVALQLPQISVVGDGMVEKQPDCGTPINLTATPVNESWRFAGWSGSIGGSDNPYVLNAISGSEQITASFQLIRNLDVVTVGPGNVTRTPDQMEYLDGDMVTLDATPDADAIFLGWSGDLSGTNPSESLAMTADKVVTSTFATVYRLELDSIGAGTVTVSPSQSDGLAAGHFFAGTMVTLTPNTAGNWRFSKWTGNITGDIDDELHPITLAMDDHKSIVARFIETQKLTVTKIGKGTGSVAIMPPSPDGVYEKGTPVSLTATAGEKSLFSGWTGSVADTGPSIRIVLNSDKTLTAGFLPLFTVVVATGGGGVITVDPVKSLYVEGESVTLTATPADGFTFAGWDGLPGNTNPLTVPEIVGDLAVTALFVENPTELKQSIEGQGLIAADPSRTTFAPSEIVALRALPDAGWRFVRWEGDLPATVDSTADKIALPMDVGRTVKAVFELDSRFLYLPIIVRE